AHHHHRQRDPARGRRRLGRREPALRAARADGPARLEERLRAGRVRVLHRLPGRRAGLRLPGGGRAGDRPGGDHRGGPGHRGRAAPRAAGVRRGRRRPVRLLHPWAARGRPRPDRAGARPVRPRDPRGPGGQSLPLHRLREDPRRGPAGRLTAGAGM
ncbi:MAG: Xanthine dehydrogenase iron-sulfur subunit, partial [uncultured Pseudonocardia sp.]